MLAMDQKEMEKEKSATLCNIKPILKPSNRDPNSIMSNLQTWGVGVLFLRFLIHFEYIVQIYSYFFNAGGGGKTNGGSEVEEAFRSVSIGL